MASSLKGLPPEILEIIASYCIGGPFENHGLLRLRSTCRDIEEATHYFWLHTYFSHRYIDLDAKNLRRLRDVAAIPEFASAVTTISVRCVDDSKMRRTKLMEIAPLFAAAIMNLQNVMTINLEVSEDGSRDRSSTNGDMIIDFSNTFGLVLLAVNASILRPLRISCTNTGMIDWEDVPYAGITKHEFMGQLTGACFSKLRVLELPLEVHSERTKRPEFARHLAKIINQMQSLTTLSLIFLSLSDTVLDTLIMTELAKSVHLPYLAKLELSSLSCEVRQVSRFLCKHALTLTSCSLLSLTSLESDSADVFSELLMRLQDTSNLEYLEISDFEALGRWTLDFPTIDCTIVSDHENEDGYLEVYIRPGVSLRGREEVENGLMKMNSDAVAMPIRFIPD